jgi:hypothetical protein
VAITLRTLTDSDLDSLFIWESDPRAVQMAAFTRANPSDRGEFDAHYERVRNDPSATLLAIDDEAEFVGTVASFTMEGKREVSYWIAPARWGQGLASRALRAFPCDRADQADLRPRGASQRRVGEGACSRGLCRGWFRNGFRARSRRGDRRAHLPPRSLDD